MKIIKCLSLFVIGLICAIFVYPFLHEAGHCIAIIAFGNRIEDLTLFPLPSVACTMSIDNVVSYIVIGVGGIIFPILISLLLRFKNFWLWYALTVLRLICIWSLILSIVASVMVKIGMPLINDDMTMVLQKVPSCWWLCGLIATILAALIITAIFKTKPIEKINELI